MNCHGNENHGGRNKRMWLVVLLVAVLAVGLWAAFGKGGLVGLLPFVGIILCPIIHSAMFIFLGKNLMQGSKREQPASQLNESK